MAEEKTGRIVQRPPVENDPKWLSIRLRHLKSIHAQLVYEIRRVESKLASLADRRSSSGRHTSH